jgi:hypothetical protein
MTGEQIQHSASVCWSGKLADAAEEFQRPGVPGVIAERWRTAGPVVGDLWSEQLEHRLIDL